MKQKCISVFGAGFTNKGAEAMLKTLRLHVSQDILINVFVDFDSDMDELVDPKQYKLVRNPKGFTEYLRFVFFSILFVLFKYEGKYYRNIIALNESNEVIDLSGFALTDDFSKNSGTYRSVIFLIQAFVSKVLFRKKYYIYPQAFGPYQRKLNYFLSKLVVLIADKTFVRGKRSFKYLNCGSSKCIQTSDFVFSRFFREQYAYEIEIPFHNYILINPNSRIYHKEKKVGKSNYIEFLSKLIKSNLTRGYNIVLTPNEIRENEEDDLFICTLLKELVDDERVFLNSNLDLTYLLNLVGKAELSIVSRFHLMVFSLIMTKPLLVLSWSDKYLDIMEEFELEKFCLKQYSDSYDLIDDLMINRSSLQANIEKKLKIIEADNQQKIFGKND